MKSVAVVGLGYWGPNLARNFDELGALACAVRPRRGPARTLRRALSERAHVRGLRRAARRRLDRRRRHRDAGPDALRRSRSVRSRPGSTRSSRSRPRCAPPRWRSSSRCRDASARAHARAPAALPPRRAQAEGADRGGRARRGSLRLRQPPEPRQDPQGRERAVVARRARSLGRSSPARRGAVGGDRARPRLPQQGRRGRRVLLPALSVREDRAHAPVVARPAQDAAHHGRRPREDGRLRRHGARAEGDDLRQGARGARRRATASG